MSTAETPETPNEVVEPVPPPRRPILTRPRIIFGAVFLGLGLLVAGLSVRGEPPRKVKETLGGGTPTVTPAELAGWGLEGRRDYVVIDMRPHDDFKAEHIRGAVSCGTCHQSAAEGRGETFVDLTKKLVLYAQAGDDSITLPRSLAKNRRLYVLAGGYEAWKGQVMAPVTFGGETDEAELAAKQRREAVRAFYAGERAKAGPANLPLAPIRRASPHAPAKPTEGC